MVGLLTMRKRVNGSLPPIAKKTDPTTSHKGARSVTRSGRRINQISFCLRLVINNPGSICDELGEISGLGYRKVSKRLSDLKNLGLIEQCGERQSLESNHSQLRWWPAGQVPKKVRVKWSK